MSAPSDISELRARWNDVLDHLESHDRIAWISYFDARLASLEGAKITLDFSDARKLSGGHEYSPTREKLKNSLISAIRDVLGFDAEIDELP
ncbi:MAG: hypothetical protein QNL07_05115 [Candidatus Planktophila sp.]|jgi:hypothetical protein|tara:strand:- start:672 stop:944 length:273 start_codon:yes stop_codon:yes gene_type:complete